MTRVRTTRHGAAPRSVPAVLLGCAAVLVGGLCGCAGPSDEDAVRVTASFYAAVDAGDGTAACAVLAPATAAEVAHESGRACPDALLAPGGPGDPLVERAALTEVREVSRAGGQAQVVTEGDTVFLARSGDVWVVTAAGCEPRGERPYRCAVEP